MKTLKYFLYRQKLRLPDELPPQLQFKIAQTKAEYLTASKILYTCYREKGFTAANDNGVRLTPYHILPSTTVILALWDNEIIGTISLIRDNPIGLPIEAVFDIEKLRTGNHVLCEVSALAIKKEFRGKSGEIFHPLIRYTWNYALRYFGVDYFVIAVNPSMFEIYESIYLFQPLERLKQIESYEFANNNPAIGEYVNVKSAFGSFKKKYGRSAQSKNIYEFMTKQNLENSLFPDRRYYSHIDSPVQFTWLQDFESYIPEILAKPSLKDGIAQSFGFINYQEAISAKQQRQFRIPVSFEVANLPGLKVVDISVSGLKLTQRFPEKISPKTILNCQISPEEKAQVVIEPVWRSSQHQWGFQILDCSQNWVDMMTKVLPKTCDHSINRAA